MKERKLRIAWFTHIARPGAPVASLSQYCTDLLLPYVREHFDIEVFCGLYSGEHLGVPRHHYLTAYRRHREQPFDIFFYQLEDGVVGRFIRTQIGITPGVTWMHDLYLSDLGSEATHVTPWEQTLAKYFDSAQPFGDRKNPPHQLRPRAFRETALSPMVLTSSQWAKREFDGWVHNRLEYVPGAHRCEYVPLPILPQPRTTGSPDAHELRVVATGGTDIAGRAHKFLPALASLKMPWHLTWVVDPLNVPSAHLLIEEFQVEGRVTVIGGATPEEWSALVATSDLALHIHDTPFFHLGPYLHLSMAAGCPVVVIRSGSAEAIPEEAAFSIVPGVQEMAQLVGVFEAVAENRSAGLGDAGRRYIMRECDVAATAERLSTYLREAAPALVGVMKRWDDMYGEALDALSDEICDHIDAPLEELLSSFDTIVAPLLAEIQSSTK
jgi:glycosyltransferase involved in cell wall biosynthesis